MTHLATPPTYGTALDYTIIAVYMVFIFGLGTLLARYNRSTRDFFMGGQRFGWWVIALSLIATTVGSYSFVKYSAMAYLHGLAATQSYLNDWFWMPLFMFVWLPIIYYARVNSVPEYFERRFDRRTRAMVTIILLVYMLGYIGINLLTMGKVVAQLLGYEQSIGPVFLAAAIVAVVCAAYVSSGGQAAVILTDVVQGLLLLGAGLWLMAIGVAYVGGWQQLWDALTPLQRMPLAPLNDPPEFNFIGVFWQDAVANSMVVYFLNQGNILRFLSGRSVDTGRKSVVWLLLCLQLLAALAVANAGWIGRALAHHGVIAPDSKPDEIFMIVSHLLCSPGVFGFVLAALTAALMSTADTLINATASVWVNDVWRLYVRPNAPDAHHLRVGRWVSVLAAAVGLAMVPVYHAIGTIYQAHGAFTAAVGPPMAVAVMLGMLWKRFTPAAAFWTMLGGLAAISLSFVFPELIKPFAMGVAMDPDPWKAYSFQRAFYGIVVSLAIGLVVTARTRPKPAESLVGLVAGTLSEARRRFKQGGGPAASECIEDEGPRVRVRLVTVARTERQPPDDRGHHDWIAGEPSREAEARWLVFAAPEILARLRARPRDLVSINDARWIVGDLRGGHAVIMPADPEMRLGHNEIGVPAIFSEHAQLDVTRTAVARRVL